MKTIEITQHNLETLIRDSKILILDFWAAWCGPCRMFSPIFEAAAARHPGVTFGKVNTESEQAVAAAFRIRSIPTLVVFREGVPVFQQAGMLEGQMLDQLIAQVEALDMQKVRETYEAAEARS